MLAPPERTAVWVPAHTWSGSQLPVSLALGNLYLSGTHTQRHIVMHINKNTSFKIRKIRGTHTMHRHTCRKNNPPTHTYKIKIKSRAKTTWSGVPNHFSIDLELRNVFCNQDKMLQKFW